MADAPLPSRFSSLPVEKQTQIRETGERLVRFAYEHSFPITIAPPPGSATLNQFHNGTGFILKLGDRLFLVTADHVLEYYLIHRKANDGLVFQAAQFRLWPEERPIWRDNERDIALVEITAGEARRVGTLIVDPPTGWPPQLPVIGSYVMFSGFPAVVREHVGDAETNFNALSSLMRVTTRGEGYFVCQFERDEWVNFGRVPVPERGTSLGGMSGAPVFSNGALAFPLVGLISEFSADFELLYVKTLESIPFAVPAETLGTS
jgi:hypothetical protein